MPLHNQIILNGYVENPIKDTDEAIAWLSELVDKIGMKIVQGPFASYVDAPGNRGITGAVMIETSHIAFHIWDEEDPALLQFDLYTCSTLDAELVIKDLKEKMGLTTYQYMIIERANGFKVTATKLMVE
jgi:S-adenosylmethionine/arginine decarboxylase-like enzyme